MDWFLYDSGLRLERVKAIIFQVHNTSRKKLLQENCCGVGGTWGEMRQHVVTGGKFLLQLLVKPRIQD